MNTHFLFADTAMLADGWADNVRIGIDEAGRITSLEHGAKAAPGDTRAAIALPAMANVHCHAFQRAMAGLAERAGPAGDNFWTWRTHMYDLAGRITPDDLRVIAALAYMEMLESGFTAVGEFHYLHHAPDGTPYDNPAHMSLAIAEAAQATGIGLALLPVFYAHGGFGEAALQDGQRRFAHTLDSYAALIDALKTRYPQHTIGIAPHSLRAVRPDELRALAEAFPACPVHIHIAEQVREVEDCRVHLGASPVRWLLDNVDVDERWCLIHATHMDAGETGALARAGAVAGLCPITEANLGDGIFPAVEYLQKGGKFALGSDSCVRIDLCEEVRLLDYSQRLRDQTRTPLAPPKASSGAALYAKALNGGAQALAQKTGALEIGKNADIITLDANHPALASRTGDDLIDGWIYAANRPAIDTVYAKGKKLVCDGRHVNRDIITSEYNMILEKSLY